MLNICAALNSYLQNPLISGQSIHHYLMAKYIEDQYNVGNYDFLVITPYLTYTNIYKLHND